MPPDRAAAAAAAGRLVARVLDELIVRARMDPATVVEEARKRGIPVMGEEPWEQLASLRRCHPLVLDPLAASFISSNFTAAGVQGFVANVGGVLTLPVAIGADAVGTLALLVRTTSGVMGSYGFDTETEEGAAQLRMGLLVAGGVNRLAASGSEVLGRRLAQRLGMRLGRQRLAKAVPVVGGVIGAGVNMAMVRSMGRRAQVHYRQLLMDWQANQVWPAPLGSSPVGALPPGPLGELGTGPRLPPPP